MDGDHSHFCLFVCVCVWGGGGGGGGRVLSGDFSCGENMGWCVLLGSQLTSQNIHVNNYARALPM